MNRIEQQVELIHIIVSLFEVADRRGLFELEKYLYSAADYNYLVDALKMVLNGTDPQTVSGHLINLSKSEGDPDTCILKKMVELSVPLIQAGAVTPFSIKFRLFTLVSPEVEHYYTLKHLEFEQRKNRFYAESKLFSVDPELQTIVENIFLLKKITGYPVDFSTLEYRTIALALLGCSRAIQVIIFEYFPFIEAEKFIDYHDNNTISETDVINAMREIEKWEEEQKISREKIIEWQRGQSTGK